MNTTRFIVNFAGEAIQTIVADKASAADEWVREILSSHATSHRIIVGLDCEWRPTFIPNTSNRCATMQLCVGNRCLIVQLFYIDAIPSSLKDFVRAPNVTFVGLGVGNDVQKLRTEYDLSCLHWEDIEPLAMRYRNWAFFGLTRSGLKVLARQIVGLHMEKPKHVTQSDWQARELSEAQIRYACIDAYASYKLGVELLG